MLLYALASAGGAMAYVPFLTILLPIQVAGLSADQQVTWLAYITLAGSCTSALANIVFGWLSDRLGDRRRLIIGGLFISLALLVSMPIAKSLPVLIAITMAWQLFLNMMLAPLAALAGDYIPDHQKGTLGGLLALAPAAGASLGLLITIPGLAGPELRLVLVAGFVAAFVLPVVLIARPRPMPELMQPLEHDPALRDREPRVIVIRMWLARFLMQIAEAALFAYLYFWFRSLPGALGDDDAARYFFLAVIIAVPVTLLAGRWADRRNRPIMPLAIAAAVASGCLLAMGLSNSLATALIAYVLFGVATSLFLSLHTAQTLRVLPNPKNRGRDLGFFNLTNSLPFLVMPALTIAMVPVFGFAGLFMLLGGFTLVSCALLISIVRM